MPPKKGPVIVEVPGVSPHSHPDAEMNPDLFKCWPYSCNDLHKVRAGITRVNDSLFGGNLDWKRLRADATKGK